MSYAYAIGKRVSGSRRIRCKKAGWTYQVLYNGGGLVLEGSEYYLIK